MAKEIIDFKFLIQLEVKGEKNVIDWCIKNKLIADNHVCPRCGLRMKLLPRDDIPDGCEWQCRKFERSLPHSVRSVRQGTWFCDSSMTVSAILQIMYLWFKKLSNEFIEKELHLEAHTVTDWKMFCRKACQEICRRENDLLGGPGVVVEIGENKFIKEGIYRGNSVDGKSIIGGVERKTSKCFFIPAEEPTREMLLDIVKEHILPGSIIISDCWKTYKCLSDKNFKQLRSTDNLVLKNPEKRADTVTLEKCWISIKKTMPPSQEVADHLESYLAEYTWRRRQVGNSHRIFMTFLSKIAEIEAEVSYTEED